MGQMEERNQEKSDRRLRGWGKLLLFLYLCGMVYFMFFSEDYGRTEGAGAYRYNLVLFREIRRFWRYRHTLGIGAMMLNIFGNVAVFIPFGFAVPLLYPGLRGGLWVPLLTLGSSLIIETLQLLLRVGCFDVDDLLLNTLGGCIGYLIFYLFLRHRRHKHG